MVMHSINLLHALVIKIWKYKYYGYTFNQNKNYKGYYDAIIDGSYLLKNCLERNLRNRIQKTRKKKQFWNVHGSYNINTIPYKEYASLQICFVNCQLMCYFRVRFKFNNPLKIPLAGLILILSRHTVMQLYDTLIDIELWSDRRSILS